MTNATPSPVRRTERTVLVLRACVAVLACVQVATIAPELDRSGLLAWGVGAAGAMLVVSAALLAAWASGATTRAVEAGAWCAALVDAAALLVVVRLTLAVDPAQTIAWALLLWVPFGIAARARPLHAIGASIALAAAVPFVAGSGLGVLEPLSTSASALGLPVSLVLVTGAATVLVTLCQGLGTAQVRGELLDERDRAARLRDADELKNTFLAAVNHELRTPLTSILGFSMTLLDRPELDEGQRERMLRHVVVEAEHLEDILANLLDLDRLTRGKATLVPREVDPSRVVAAAIDRASRRTEREVAVDLAEGLRVRLDAAKVERIVENLVGNALKYTPPDAEVRVTLRPASRGGVLIVVDDSGPGISRELRETIFEPFRRGVDMGVPGTGIGLSLVDRFSRMHGGRAWVEERTGGGCSFRVELPSAGGAVEARVPEAGSIEASVSSPHVSALARS